MSLDTLRRLPDVGGAGGQPQTGSVRWFNPCFVHCHSSRPRIRLSVVHPGTGYLELVTIFLRQQYHPKLVALRSWKSVRIRPTFTTASTRRSVCATFQRCTGPYAARTERQPAFLAGPACPFAAEGPQMRHAILNEAASLTLANRRDMAVRGGSGGWQIPCRYPDRGTLSDGPQEGGPLRGRDAGRRQLPGPLPADQGRADIPFAWRHGLTEGTAYEWFRSIRFRDSRGGSFCPACGSLKCYTIASRPCWWSCGEATYRKQFSVTSGTIFHSRKLNSSAWRNWFSVSQSAPRAPPPANSAFRCRPAT